MAVPVLRKIEIEQSEFVTNRKHPRFVRAALERVARYHVRVRMQEWKFSKNFKTAPGGPYRYQERGRQYVKSKLKKGRGDDPWVFTGLSKKYLARNYRITKTQYSATLYLESRFDLRDQAREELEAITSDEVLQMRDQGQEFYLEEIQKPENQRMRRRRVRG